MNTNPQNEWAERQIRKNAQFRDAWKRFADHRRRVTDLIVSPPATGRCCVLGAGNANDLDLRMLLATFARLHLVDIDGEAMREGLVRQDRVDEDRIVTHPGLDLSNLTQVMDQGDQASWCDRAIANAAAVSLPSLPSPFDVVASVCLLSQLLEIATELPGAAHPRYLEVVQAIRIGHLRLLRDLVAPGGTGILITDLVSSDSCPMLADVAEHRLPELVRSLVEQRNFFTGVNPAVLHAMFTTDAELASHISHVEMVPPWRWDLGPRCYAVYAVRFRKAGGGETEGV